jgi:hypothetical protein
MLNLRAFALAMLVAATGAAYASSALAGAPPSSSAEQVAKSKTLKCVQQRTCRFHLVGALTYSPKGVFAVSPKVWAGFSDADKEAYRQLAKLWLTSTLADPERILVDSQNGAGLNASAPVVPRAARNVASNLRHVEFLVSSSKMADGSPGWSEGNVVPNLEVSR